MKKGNAAALLPIGLFVILYLGLGVLFEYVLRIEMGFYQIPIVVIFMAALLAACLQNRKVKFEEKLSLMGQGIGDKNIVTMILIFLTAGVFVGTVGRESAQSVAYFMLSIIPVQLAPVVLFVVSAFVSLAMGTSVGTITLVTPIAVSVATAAGLPDATCVGASVGMMGASPEMFSSVSGFSAALCVGSVIGGAMFGDNLSFISDTTIAACNGQGCRMKDKFRENFFIALPAALLTIVAILLVSLGSDVSGKVTGDYDLVQLIPYVLVLFGGFVINNVFVVLLIGIVSGAVIMLATGAVQPTELLASMGSGVSGMYETILVTVLVTAICALVRKNGGFDALLYAAKRLFKGKKSGQLGMGLLVGAMDISTANNTVAIVMANPIAKEMAESYGVSPRKTASILDTFSCIFQGVIPYGAQMLVALTAAKEAGLTLSAFNVMPYLFYPFLLLLSSLVFIFLIPERKSVK